MAKNNDSLQLIHQPNQTLEYLFASLDPKTHIPTQNSNFFEPKSLQITPMKRGSRYRAYAELRETKLKMKRKKQQFNEPGLTITPPKKRVTFQGSVPVNSIKNASIIARSVPDFCAELRKENRKPVSNLPSMVEMTPPPSKASKLGEISKLGGSKSASGGEKRDGRVMMRKSYASFEELKGLSSAASSAIHGEGRRGRSSRGINKPVLGTRQY